MRGQKLDPWVLFLRERQESLEAQGLTLENADGLRPIFADLLKDPVPSLWTGRFRYAVLKEAIVWARETGRPLFYVEWDVKNLNGANSKLGHTGANEQVLKPLSSLIVTGVDALVQQHDGFQISFRHGGDEFSSIVGGVSNGSAFDRSKPRTLTCALDGVVRQAKSYAQRSKLDEFEHPKHLGDDRYRGTGLSYGISEFRYHPTGWMPPEAMFTEADQRVERYKRGEVDPD